MNTVRSADGTTIAFDRSGQGPPVILVGGAFNDRSTAAPLAAELDSEFTVFNYDRRGRGSSGDTSPYAVDREVEDLDALIAEAGGSGSVYGLSSGAALALEAAACGLPIDSLALFEPPFVVDGSRPRPPEDLRVQLSELTSSGRRGEAVELFVTTAVGLPAEAVAQMRNAPMWPGLEAVAHTLAYDTAVMGPGNALPAERIASVTVPTLVIESAGSPEWLRSAAQAVADVLPHAQHRTLEGQFHDVAPEVLAPELEQFFAAGRTMEGVKP
jgi:alpha-beta hydrolase superfamily lysophospholipase